jgi:hypothetical protein
VPRGANELILGIFVLALSLLLWRLTSNFWGWAVLYAPGAYFVILGIVRIFK